jgi:hypothetical protein
MTKNKKQQKIYFEGKLYLIKITKKPLVCHECPTLKYCQTFWGNHKLEYLCNALNLREYLGTEVDLTKVHVVPYSPIHILLEEL